LKFDVRPALEVVICLGNLSPRAVRIPRETDYIAAIGSCIAHVLDAAVAQKLKSVAFPLIDLLVLQFLNAIEECDDRLSENDKLHVGW
jgi:hypothetical protein